MVAQRSGRGDARPLQRHPADGCILRSTPLGGSMRPWFGLHLPSYTFPDTPPERRFDRTVEQAKTADALGFRVVTVMDHLNQIPGIAPVTEPMLEAWSVLAALARETG